MQLDLDQLRELLTTIDKTSISEFILKSGDLELTVRKGTLISDRSSFTSPEHSYAVSELISPSTIESEATAAPKTTAAVPSGTPATMSAKLVEILSPVVGTFYRSPAPDEPNFVEVGDQINSGQTVCIIEAMKVMNEIEAEVSGEIVEILIDKGEPVEYNQPLMLVNPK